MQQQHGPARHRVGRTPLLLTAAAAACMLRLPTPGRPSKDSMPPSKATANSAPAAPPPAAAAGQVAPATPTAVADKAAASRKPDAAEEEEEEEEEQQADDSNAPVPTPAPVPTADNSTWPTAVASVWPGNAGVRVPDTFLATSHEWKRIKDYGGTNTEAWARIFNMCVCVCACSHQHQRGVSAGLLSAYCSAAVACNQHKPAAQDGAISHPAHRRRVTGRDDRGGAARG